ncbi:MAG: TIR domain-containing protein [Acidobacteria bacterium]|nr:TIR domain-containing protein [Acidobacteriota bacterium]
MADAEHVAKLQGGRRPWELWRRENPEVQPKLSEAFLAAANLGRADLRGADLSRADLSGADLRGADLSDAYLNGADLTRANLSEADLTRTNLSEANLRGADLRAADLTRAFFEEANLSGADLRGVDMAWTNLPWADLTGANLSGAHLSAANFVGSDLRETHLGGAVLHESVFADTDLRDAHGLEACQHLGPSTLDYRTLARSGELPLSFLRGCGLPDSFIEYLPSLLGSPFEFYSCFISYSTQDQAFAERLHADLQDHGVRCWFAPYDIQGGKKLHAQIEEAIRVHDRLLLILSEASMASEWVKTEILHALQKERTQGRRVLFPVRLVEFEKIRLWGLFDADTGKDLAREIREYFIPDFSNWKSHDSYQQAFDRLLKDLQAGKPE